MRTLKDKVASVMLMVGQLKKFSTVSSSEEIERFALERGIKRIVEEDFNMKNPEELVDEYIQYFKQKNIPTTKIQKDETYYRARVGYELEMGSDDDLDVEFIMPYYENGIKMPPPLLSTGARFNRQGTSYLYVSDNIDTCMAEVHLQVGQLCSIGKFKCKDEVEMIDLTSIHNDAEMEIWLDILTQPVYGDIENRYNITRFLSDILRQINENGIVFNSVQSTGKNIVCYKPCLFELIPFSERLYKTKSICYQPELVEDSIDKYLKKGNYHLSSYNEKLEAKRDKVIEHIEKWIEYRVQSKDCK